MSLRPSEFVTLLLTLSLATTAAALKPCSPLAETRVVYVTVEGCARVQPKLAFDVTVAGETITVTKERPTDKYWVGETKRNFAVGNQTLTVKGDAMPGALATCLTKATPFRDGACVALFRIDCEPFWQLTVETVPANARAKIGYQRKLPDKPVIQSCNPRTEPIPEGPGQVMLALSDEVLVRVGKQRAELEIALSHGSFGLRNELRIRDVQVNPVSRNATVRATGASAAMNKAQLQKIVRDMRFIKAPEN